MSHTYEHGETRFICNSDLSGDISVIVGEERIEVPGDDIVEFVASYLVRERIAKLEQMSAKDLLVTLGAY